MEEFHCSQTPPPRGPHGGWRGLSYLLSRERVGTLCPCSHLAVRTLITEQRKASFPLSLELQTPKHCFALTPCSGFTCHFFSNKSWWKFEKPLATQVGFESMLAPDGCRHLLARPLPGPGRRAPSPLGQRQAPAGTLLPPRPHTALPRPLRAVSSAMQVSLTPSRNV